jgi:hypothetical protein
LAQERERRGSALDLQEEFEFRIATAEQRLVHEEIADRSNSPKTQRRADTQSCGQCDRSGEQAIRRSPTSDGTDGCECEDNDRGAREGRWEVDACAERLRLKWTE